MKGAVLEGIPRKVDGRRDKRHSFSPGRLFKNSPECSESIKGVAARPGRVIEFGESSRKPGEVIAQEIFGKLVCDQ